MLVTAKALLQVLLFIDRSCLCGSWQSTDGTILQFPLLIYYSVSCPLLSSKLTFSFRVWILSTTNIYRSSRLRKIKALIFFIHYHVFLQLAITETPNFFEFCLVFHRRPCPSGLGLDVHVYFPCITKQRFLAKNAST